MKRRALEESVFQPSPEEISRLTEQIRSTWSAHMLRKRSSEVADVQLMEIHLDVRDTQHYRE